MVVSGQDVRCSGEPVFAVALRREKGQSDLCNQRVTTGLFLFRFLISHTFISIICVTFKLHCFRSKISYVGTLFVIMPLPDQQRSARVNTKTSI